MSNMASASLSPEEMLSEMINAALADQDTKKYMTGLLGYVPTPTTEIDSMIITAEGKLLYNPNFIEQIYKKYNGDFTIFFVLVRVITTCLISGVYNRRPPRSVGELKAPDILIAKQGVIYKESDPPSANPQIDKWVKELQEAMANTRLMETAIEEWENTGWGDKFTDIDWNDTSIAEAIDALPQEKIDEIAGKIKQDEVNVKVQLVDADDDDDEDDDDEDDEGLPPYIPHDGDTIQMSMSNKKNKKQKPLPKGSPKINVTDVEDLRTKKTPPKPQQNQADDEDDEDDNGPNMPGQGQGKKSQNDNDNDIDNDSSSDGSSGGSGGSSKKQNGNNKSSDSNDAWGDDEEDGDGFGEDDDSTEQGGSGGSSKKQNDDNKSSGSNDAWGDDDEDGDGFGEDDESTEQGGSGGSSKKQNDDNKSSGSSNAWGDDDEDGDGFGEDDDSTDQGGSGRSSKKQNDDNKSSGSSNAWGDDDEDGDGFGEDDDSTEQGGSGGSSDNDNRTDDGGYPGPTDDGGYPGPTDDNSTDGNGNDTSKKDGPMTTEDTMDKLKTSTSNEELNRWQQDLKKYKGCSPNMNSNGEGSKATQRIAQMEEEERRQEEYNKKYGKGGNGNGANTKKLSDSFNTAASAKKVTQVPKFVQRLTSELRKGQDINDNDITSPGRTRIRIDTKYTGNYVPRPEEKGRALIAIDVSGSMGQKELKGAIQILTSAGVLGVDADLCVWDETCGRINKFDLSKYHDGNGNIALPSDCKSGSTNVSCVFRKLKQEHLDKLYNVIVIISDMEYYGEGLPPESLMDTYAINTFYGSPAIIPKTVWIDVAPYPPVLPYYITGIDPRTGKPSSGLRKSMMYVSYEEFAKEAARLSHTKTKY